MSDDVNSLLKDFATIESRRANLESWWQSIAQRVLPSAATFTTTGNEGEKRNERLFTGKPVINNERFAAVMEDLLTPRSQKWHSLAPIDDELSEDQEVMEYLERLNNLLFSLRYRPSANYASQRHKGYMALGAFGNSCLFIDEEMGVGPRYRQIPLKEAYWCENHTGQIDTLYRKFSLEKRQVEQRAAEEGWEIPPIITAEKDPYRTFEFLHTTRPNAERQRHRKDYRGWEYSQHYLCIDSKSMCKVGGFQEWPYGIGRYSMAANEVYGRSPAMTAWGAILTLNEEKKTVLKAGQKEVDPPILLQEDGILDAFNLQSGALNYGAVSQDGTPLAVPFKTGANIPLGLELMQLEGVEIEDAFLVSIFQILAEHPQMTATQVLEITQQKGTLLAPTMGQQQSEDLGPQITREVGIAARQSRFAWIQEEMPDALRERGGGYDITYKSPMARAIRASDGVAIMRTFEALPVAASLDPDAAFVLDVPQSLRELAEINGVPAKLLRDPKMIASMAQDRAAKEQLAAITAVAPDMSKAALNAAQAEQLRSA